MPEFEYPEVFKGRKGQYEIIEEAPNHIIVKYISGEWLGQVVKMSRQVHESLQRNIKHDKMAQTKGEKEATDDYLDFWFKKYPGLYNSLWYKDVQGAILLKRLEETYPEAGENIRSLVAELDG